MAVQTGYYKPNNTLTNSASNSPKSYQYDPSKSGPENEAASRLAAQQSTAIKTPAVKTTTTPATTTPATQTKRTIQPISAKPVANPAAPVGILQSRSVAPVTTPSVPNLSIPTSSQTPTYSIPGTASTPDKMSVSDLYNRVGGYDPERRVVDPRTETVQGQIGNIISADSPLMQQAATRGLQQANRRGLLNSSMAVGSAESALYDAALPIAQQDASTYSGAASQNQVFGNEALQFGASAKNVAAGKEFDAGQEAERARFGAEQEANIADYGTRAEASRAAFGAEKEANMAEFNAQREANLATFGAGTESEMARYDAENKARLAEFDAQQQQQILERQGQIEKELQGIQGQQALDLAIVEKQYDTLMRTSEDATGALNSAKTAISNIMVSDMNGRDKDALISLQVELLKNDLSVIGKIGNVDLEGLLDYSGSGGSLPAHAGGQKKKDNASGVLDPGTALDPVEFTKAAEDAWKKIF